MSGGFLKRGYRQIIHMLIGCSFVNHPFGGIPIYGNLHIKIQRYVENLLQIYGNPAGSTCLLGDDHQFTSYFELQQGALVLICILGWCQKKNGGIFAMLYTHKKNLIPNLHQEVFTQRVAEY